MSTNRQSNGSTYKWVIGLLVTVIIAVVSLGAGRESMRAELNAHKLSDGHPVLLERTNNMERKLNDISDQLQRMEVKIDNLR